MPTEENKVTSEYGKMSVWQWVVVYLIVGLIIYGLFYVFLTYKKGGENSYPKSQNNDVSQEQTPVEEVNLDKDVAEIELTDDGYSPNLLTVNVGTKVTWINNSSAVGSVNSSVHPTHEDYAPLNLGDFDLGESLTLVFNEVGTYKYHNHLNPTQFGTIEVVVEEQDLGTEDEQAPDEGY